MVKPIMKDIFFLGQKSEPATKADLQVGKDLMDTLAANREGCVGMAANMIGVKKSVIIVNMGFVDVVMFNPVLVRKESPYETEEGCLSLTGVRKTTRYQMIEVEYLDMNWKKQKLKLDGWTAQICQHEMCIRDSHYDVKDRVFERADKFAERQKEKAAKLDKNEHTGKEQKMEHPKPKKHAMEL